MYHTPAVESEMLSVTKNNISCLALVYGRDQRFTENSCDLPSYQFLQSFFVSFVVLKASEHPYRLDVLPSRVLTWRSEAVQALLEAIEIEHAILRLAQFPV